MILTIIGQIALFLSLCYLLNWLRGKFQWVDDYWKNGVVWLFLAVILIHIGIWWKWPVFWDEWWSRSGFLFFQILLGVGLYLRFGLKDKKFLKYFGLLLVVLGSIGVGWNIISALRTNYSVAEVMSPSELKDLPPQNKEVEKAVTKFWKKHLPEQSALSMLRIVRRQSGFNQFAKDGKSPYRNEKLFNYKRAGVMQINDAIWRERSTELGEDYNLYTLDGNLRFALWLYNEQGFAPWRDSSGGQTTTTSISSVTKDAKDIVLSNISHLPLADSMMDLRPEENAGMRTAVVEYLQKNMLCNDGRPDIVGQQFLIRTASEASRFNQLGLDGKTALNRKVSGREKIGVMGIDQRLWSWFSVENGAGADIYAPDGNGNLAGALELYKKFKALAWTHPDKIRPSSRVISVPADGETEPVPVRVGAWHYLSGDMFIITETGKKYVDGPDRYVVINPPAKTMVFKSLTGQPEVVVLNN